MANSTISQRIALEGAEEITRQLTDLGAAGEKAIGQIQNAANGMSPALAGLSNIAATLRTGFGQVGEALAPVRARLTELGEAATEVGAHLKEVASVLGVGLVGGIAGGIAGIVELIKSSAEAGHQLEIQAATLGLTTTQLQAYRKVALDAGVDGDRVFTALTKLTQNLGKETEKLSQETIKAFADLPTSMQAVGTALLRGPTLPQAGTGRGIINSAAIGESAAAVNQFVDQFKFAQAEMGKALDPTIIEQYRQNVIKASQDVSQVGEAWRLNAVKAGVAFPALTIGEMLKRDAEIAADPILRLGLRLGDLQKAGENLDIPIRQVLDGLGRIESPAQRNQIALALLGRSAKELAEAFHGGSGSLDEALAKIAASPLALSPEQAAVLAETERELNRLGAAGSGLRNQLSLIFAPALISATTAFADLIKNNADTFKAWAQVIANEVLPGLANLIKQFGGAGEAAKGAGKELPASGMPGATAEVSAVAGATAPSSTDAAGVENLRARFESLLDTVMKVGTAIATAFTTVRSVLMSAATAVNAVFGTNFNAAGLAAVLVVGQLTGVFALLLPLLGLAAAAIALLATPVGFVTAAIALAVIAIINWRSSLAGITDAAAAVGAGISANFTTALSFVSNFLGAISSGIQSLVGAIAPTIGGVFSIITQAISGALDSAGNVFANFFSQTLPNLISFVVGLFPELWSHLGDGLSLAITSIREAIDSLTGFITRTVQIILAALGGIGDLISSIASRVAGLGSAAAGGGSTGPVGGGDQGNLGVDAGAGAPGFALGGMARGPGGTDTIPAWLSMGEFVTRAAAVQHYGADLFHALNVMALPADFLRRGFSLGGMVDALGHALTPAPLMFATGGPVLAPASGSGPTHVLNLTIGNEEFRGLMAPGAVYDRLARHARSSAVRSGGRKPSWFVG